MDNQEIIFFIKFRIKMAEFYLARSRKAKRKRELKIQIERLRQLLKKRRCAYCGEWFQPRRYNMRCCSQKHAVARWKKEKVRA